MGWDMKFREIGKAGMNGRKKDSYIFVLKSILLLVMYFLTGCSKKPEIITTAELNSITDDEFRYINNLNISEAKKEDYIKLIINVKIINSKKASERVMHIPNLFLIDQYDRMRSIRGNTHELNNIKVENTALSMAEIIFDRRGLTIEDIKEIYKDAHIYVKYRIKNEVMEKNISIGDQITMLND